MISACPTQQLVMQVAQVAAREGVAAVMLVGSHHDWSTPDQARYEGESCVLAAEMSTVSGRPVRSHRM